MSTPTDIDRAAPVIAHHEIDIQAPPELVWRTHADVNAWPSWHPDITEAHLEGPFESGNAFDWRSYGFAVTSTIYAVADRSRVLWGGTANGITGVHEWTFTETPSGTHVTTSESFAGEPVEADSPSMQTLLDASLQAWLEHLKQAAEART
jgi:uncharacterized protein YndB with AHSA1/START domain